MTALVALLVGVASGLAALALSWSRLVGSRAIRLFERLQVEGGGGAVRRQVDSRRAELKEQLGEELSPRLGAFDFEPADVRFLGSPAHFVVFAGHTAVKDRRAGEMSEVVFVTLGTGTGDGELLEECLRSGRVRWSTLRIGAGDGTERV